MDDALEGLFIVLMFRKLLYLILVEEFHRRAH